MTLRDYLRKVGIPDPIIKNPRICTDQERQDVLVRDNFTCRYCGKKDTKFHIDHVYPYSLGGLTTISNLVTACARCNSQKHNSIGMWPKPIGYFEPKIREIHIGFTSLVCTCFTMSTLYLGVDCLINYPEYSSIGIICIFIGMVLGLLSIGFQTQGK